MDTCFALGSCVERLRCQRRSDSQGVVDAGGQVVEPFGLGEVVHPDENRESATGEPGGGVRSASVESNCGEQRHSCQQGEARSGAAPARSLRLRSSFLCADARRPCEETPPPNPCTLMSRYSVVVPFIHGMAYQVLSSAGSLTHEKHPARARRARALRVYTQLAASPMPPRYCGGRRPADQVHLPRMPLVVPRTNGVRARSDR